MIAAHRGHTLVVKVGFLYKVIEDYNIVGHILWFLKMRTWEVNPSDLDLTVAHPLWSCNQQKGLERENCFDAYFGG